MTADERCGLVLAIAQELHANGQSTDRTINVASRLGDKLGLDAQIVPSWDALLLRVGERDGGQRVRVAAAHPSSVNMRRVASAMRLADSVCDGRCTLPDAAKTIGVIRRQPADAAPVFVGGCALGAAALALLFGAAHPASIALAAASAAAGGAARRALERFGVNPFVQAAVAALLAGLVGAAAARHGWSSSLHLVAICPCMILVPGPHILNGMFDLLALRIPLGAARLLFATLTLLAASLGLLAGLALGGVSLPETGLSFAVSFWRDAVAAGAAAAAYSIFFATPYRMLAWPVALGMAAHAARWAAITLLGASAILGVTIACLIVGAVMAPLARRLHLPFAAIGFACVVSQLPGAYVFRLASGLTRLLEQGVGTPPMLVTATLADATIAFATVLAMALGLAAPKALIEAAKLDQRAQGDQP